MDLILRRARALDAPVIADQWLAMMREHQGFEPRLGLTPGARDHYREYVEQHITSDDGIVLVLETPRSGFLGHSRIVGFLVSFTVRNYPMFTPPEYGFISDVTIVPDLRGQGLGARLVAAAEREFHHRGIDTIHLHIYMANESGRQFWQRMGYASFIEGCMKLLPHG